MSPGNEEKIELIKDLSENFRFRYKFYWSSYYKLAFYNLLIIFSPYILFFWKFDDDGSSILKILLNDFGVYFMMLPIFVLVLGLYFLKHTCWLLDQENQRILSVHDAYKKIYNVFDINLEVSKLLEPTGGRAQSTYRNFFIWLHVVVFLLGCSFFFQEIYSIKID